MATVSEAFAIAVQHHRQGRLDAAWEIYRRIVQAEPTHADSWHLLGVISAQLGDHRVAVEYFDRALTLRPDWAEAQANLGSALREIGQPARAAAVLQRALRLKPDFAAAQNNLGNAFEDLGNLDEAVACYSRALELHADFAQAHGNLGNALKKQGKTDRAVASFRRAAQLKPDDAVAHFNLGVAFADLGKLDEALVCYRQALALKPDYAEAHNNLGNTLKGMGNLQEAITCYEQAIELRPDYATALNNLGSALTDLGKPEEALACCRRALELRPDFVEAHNNLGIAWSGVGKLDEAAACYRRALELRPNFAEAQFNLGNVFGDQGYVREALDCFNRSLELWPEHAEAHSNAGNALKGLGRLNEAIASHRRALELKPDYAQAWNNLGNAHRDQGSVDEAIDCYRRALALKPDYATAHSNLLCTLHYCAEVTPAALAEAHREFDRLHTAPLLPDVVALDRSVMSTRARLRVGFVSPDLGCHPVGYFLVRVLENLSHDRHEVICYSDRIVKDRLSDRLQVASTHWRDTFSMSHERLATQIKADGIDILFDLAGHTACNRLLVFARKPAPIQIAWIGYEGTTGLAAIDYLMADHWMVPEGCEGHYREKILRMPDGYLCYDPPEGAPPVGPPPCLSNGFTTFGSFNNPAKITPAVVSVWAKVLHALPNARLVMKYRALRDPTVKRRFVELFAAHGVGTERLDLLPWTPYDNYLATYHHVDVALDPFPFSGSTTTCEALWMGVPVITCAGDTFASRHSLSHLTNLGLAETIARDHDEYVEMAVSLAGDQPRLAGLRSELRERMAASPLCDGKRFAANFTSMLGDVWNAHAVGA